MTVTRIHPEAAAGTAVTRIHPLPTEVGGGGGGGDTYTIYNSPWTVEEPWQVNFFGDTYELGANANFFAPEPACSSTPF